VTRWIWYSSSWRMSAPSSVSSATRTSGRETPSGDPAILGGRSALPEVLHELGVGLDVRAEDQHFEALVAGLERARDARAHPHGIERLEIDQLVVELHAP